MRGRAMMLATAFGLAAPAAAQSDKATEAPRTAEQFIETARKAYKVEEPEPAPCPEATNDEIVVCRQFEDMPDQRLPSPTQRAHAAGDRPPDPIPAAPYVLGLPECGVEVVCHRVGRTPPPIYVIDFDKIPKALTPEEAAQVFRAEDLSAEPANPEVASPAAAP